MGSPQQPADRLDSGPLPRWTNFLFIAIMIAVSIICRGRPIEWAVLFGLALAISAAIFWRKHGRRWFWPALGFLAAAHLILVAHTHWALDAGSAGPAYMLCLLFDVAVDSLWLFWMGWLLDPREAPRTSAQMTMEVVVYGFVIIFIAMASFLIWAFQDADKEVAKLSRVIMERSSANAMGYLERCLGADGRGHHMRWQDMPGAKPTAQIYDNISDLGMIVTDTGRERIVRITTLRARPLQDREAARIAHCLEPASSED
jgi:hypothetical protein